MRLTIPKLRTWHLLGIIAASAGFFSVMQFRWSVEDPGYDLIRRLRSLDPVERAMAAGGLSAIRPPERRAIGPLLELLYDPDAGPRAAAARALALIVRDDKEDPQLDQVKAALASVLGDRDPVARRAIAVTLAQYQAEPKVVLPTLLGFTKDAVPEARAEAIATLGEYARRDGPAQAALFAALDDPDMMVRWRAVHALQWCASIPTSPPRRSWRRPSPRS